MRRRLLLWSCFIEKTIFLVLLSSLWSCFIEKTIFSVSLCEEETSSLVLFYRKNNIFGLVEFSSVLFYRKNNIFGLVE